MQNLNNEKLTLTEKYNNEVIKQASQTMSFEDINKSKELSEQLNKEIENLSKQITEMDDKSSELNKQVATLAVEIEDGTLIPKDLSNQMSALNIELQSTQKLLTSKKVQLEDIKKTVPKLNNNLESMNKRLEQAKLEKDLLPLILINKWKKKLRH